MNVLNDINPLSAADKALKDAGVPTDKIMLLSGDFESQKFWDNVDWAYQLACKKAISRGEKPPELVITEFGGTPGNRGPEGLKRQMQTMRKGLTGKFIYVASIDGTGTNLTAEDRKDTDSKDLHKASLRQIRKTEALGRARLKAAYDIPETKHFAHMNIFNLLHMNRLMNDPRELAAQVRVCYPRQRARNISSAQFIVRSQRGGAHKVALPDYAARKKSVEKNLDPNARYAPKFVTCFIENGFEFAHELLTKWGRTFTKNLFLKAGAETVRRFGYIDDGRYPGVNHGLYCVEMPSRSSLCRPGKAANFLL